jgi:protein-tyrosine phosphatase
MVAKHRLLFVCLGNICRSPMAEGIFIHRAAARGVRDRFEVDSCGLGGWHAGERADPRARAAALRHGVEIASVARQFEPSEDSARFDLLLAMDRANMRGLLERGAAANKVVLMRSYDATLQGSAEAMVDVPDPYYGADRGFDDVYEMLVRACDGLLDALGGNQRE